MSNRIFRYSLLAGFALIIGLGLWYYLHNAKYYPSTDNAYVKGHIVPIACQVTGAVAEINVHDLQFVKKGDVLFKLDQRPFKIAYDHALADYVENQKTSARTLELVAKHYLAITLGDKAISNVKIAKSKVDKALLDLEYSTVRAPEDGYVVKFELRPGAIVNANQPLFSMVGTKEWWVEANFKETDLERIRPGQKAIIVVDMYPRHEFHGVVYNLSTGSGASFSLLPAENATGNWVKVTSRFPVRVDITDPHPDFPLRIGASAVVTIDTKKSP